MDKHELQETLRRKRLAKYRFQSLCRKVIANDYWLKTIEDTTIGSNPRRNINIIIRRSGKKGIISLGEKSMFNTPDECRTSEVREKLKLLIQKLPCFQTIPPQIRETLVSICNFQYCKPQKVIIREGHHASALYFIIDGEVTVSKRAYSVEVGDWIDDVLYALVPGDMFGMDGLIFGSRRAVTCTAAIHTEVLYIHRQDVSNQLWKALNVRWEHTQLALKRFDYYFGHFTEQQTMECCTFSKIRQYELDEVICYKDEDKVEDERSTVFFVLSGKCMILQCLIMKRKSFNNQKHYTLIDVNQKGSERIQLNDTATTTGIASVNNVDGENYLAGNTNEKKEVAFMDVGTLSTGSIFGIGEETIHRSIVAKNVVQCLEIPRFWLLQRSQNIGNVWQRTKNFYATTIPSRELVFRDFLKTNTWKDYRSKTIKQLFSLKSKL